MVKAVRLLIPLVVFILLLALLVLGLRMNPHRVPSVLLGRGVPDFKAKQLFKPRQTITQTVFNNKVSLLNVFASWCLSCRAEHPVLMDIKNSGLVDIFGLDYKDQRAAVKQWFKQDGNPYQAIINDPKGDIAINFGVYGTPETFVIDRKGFIRYKLIGPISPDTWQHTLLPLIKKITRERT